MYDGEDQEKQVTNEPKALLRSTVLGYPERIGITHLSESSFISFWTFDSFFFSTERVDIQGFANHIVSA